MEACHSTNSTIAGSSVPIVTISKLDKCVLHADMRTVLLGSGGAILDFEWFLNYRDIKLIRQASKI